MLWLTELDWTLFFSALISSTLFPGGSEALLLYRLDAGASQPLILVFIATFGNVLGSFITYGMGRLGIRLNHRWFQVSDKKLAKAEAHFERFGKAALLFAWLPVIGDPLCLVAGVLRYPVVWFIILVTLGKLSRYTILAWTFL